MKKIFYNKKNHVFFLFQVHAYRAALEKMLVDFDPKLHHSKIRSIKHSDTLTFERYLIKIIIFLLTLYLSIQATHPGFVGSNPYVFVCSKNVCYSGSHSTSFS